MVLLASAYFVWSGYAFKARERRKEWVVFFKDTKCKNVKNETAGEKNGPPMLSQKKIQ